jgi:hypothetical protein
MTRGTLIQFDLVCVLDLDRNDTRHLFCVLDLDRNDTRHLFCVLDLQIHVSANKTLL